MRFLNFTIRILLSVVVLSMINAGCRPEPKILKSPPHYNFSKVEIIKLDDKLREISGLAYDSKANLFLSVNDELGTLFFLDRETKFIKNEFPFVEKGDYEDVAVLNGIPYILRSDGKIIKFVKDSSGKATSADMGTVGLSGENDFETMYSDPSRNALVVICKNCKSDDEKSVSAFAFYPDSVGFEGKALYTLDADKITELSPFKSSKFQPSAAAINPVLQKLFIISSASNQLAIADLNGNVESVHKLSKKLFPQPEGIAFRTNGDMYISNEGVNVKSTLLRFQFFAISDSGKTQVTKSGYDFSSPDDKMTLGKHLHEISGMAYIPKKDLILTENDEKGDIFSIDFKNKNDNIEKIKFGGKGDYEDIVYANSNVYMLVSTGTVVEVETKDSTFATKEFTLERGGTSEFETMYLDGDGKSLILLCKQCSKEKDQIRQAYRFDLATKTFTPAYTIEISSIQKMLGDDKAEFKPSAAGINPVNGKLYIVASVGKLLVVADKDGKVEQVFKLDPVLYNQPEGMTFAPNGDLYISNEGGEGVATILKFVYKK